MAGVRTLVNKMHNTQTDVCTWTYIFSPVCLRIVFAFGHFTTTFPPCISDFSVAVPKYHGQGSLEKEELIWLQRLETHHGRELWQQAAGMAAGARN